MTILYNFDQQPDGMAPYGNVVLDTKGNIYGTAPGGGAYGYGVLFEITAAGQYSILYNFTGGADGWTPQSPPVYKGGSLYGTTQSGGAGCTWGCGVIYKYTLAKGKKAGKETVLYTFSGVPDGQYPLYGALVFDKSGNLYIADTGNQRVRKVTPQGTITTVAGNGTSGYSGDGGPATAAEVRANDGVAVDSTDHLFLADGDGSVVRS